jgi:type I restriction enzyme S subunit
LRKKTSEIDQIIANKQKLIALYEEEKQAIIYQAVTKGLDPNIKLKDSGVEWLGEIPEHWEVNKLNYCFGQIGSGTTPTSGKPEYYENGELNWLQTGDLNDSEIIETSKKITPKALEDYSTLRFYPLDSIVIAMYGATIGKTGILKIESTTNQACCVLSKPKNMLPKFVFYWFNAVKKHIISLSYGGGQPNINQEQIRSLKIQQPTIDEQKLIVEYIENELSQLSVIISKFNKKIDLLQEYRTTLISEVVTGKIKVLNTIEA